MRPHCVLHFAEVVSEVRVFPSDHPWCVSLGMMDLRPMRPFAASA